MGVAQAGDRKLICSGCGRKLSDAHDFREREVRDLPWGEYWAHLSEYGVNQALAISPLLISPGACSGPGKFVV